MTARVFVAGASGVLGRRVVPALVSAGHAVTANVRDAVARQSVIDAGATPITIDLFDSVRTGEVAAEHDVVVNIATSIPTGASALRRSGWTTNDRLRTDAAANLAAGVAASGGRYIGESITFPYVDSGDDWIDEHVERTYFSGNATSADAEAAARSAAEVGVGVSLRFAMFFADDSAHIQTFRSMARRGVSGLIGRGDAYISFVHVDDAATAVLAALDVPSGIYNVAEPAPVPRADHVESMGRASGRRVRSLPAVATRLGGGATESLSKSHRISSAALVEASTWEPKAAVVDLW